ncbi:MAG TPA: anhydro-N-acetylmuramic acid kinase [Flavitalea sp.]|nr:anhydro-N-acetylmuramic acid kinase [Flavitalea sp.]
MVYRVIGLMSGSSLDGLDIAFVELQEAAGKWTYEIRAAATYAYDEIWIRKLSQATLLSAREYQLLHTDFGHLCARMVNRFIDEHRLQYQAQLIGSHGHTTFHLPAEKMTAQLGDGAAIAAGTGINVVSDLRAMDVALGGHGAPIVPIGERLLLKNFPFFLNLGGIANLSYNGEEKHLGFDVCPANRVLNLLSNEMGLAYDDGGKMAAAGQINVNLLSVLNGLEYYRRPYPKSLANDFGIDVIYPLIQTSGINLPDALRTFTEHIVYQIAAALQQIIPPDSSAVEICVTGGGAHNDFLIKCLREQVKQFNASVFVPDRLLIDFKEAVIMGFIGLLRWREEYNVLASVTGASRDSIGGAVWMGQEA